MRVQFPYIFSILLFCGIWAGAFAQQSKIDSLKHVVRTAGQDTNKVNALNELCKLVGTKEENYDSALVYANQAKILAQKINYKKGIATSLKQIGWVSRHQSKYHKALKEFSVALKLFEEVGDKKGIAACHHNLGDINWYLGNYPEALKEYYASLKIDEEIVNKSGIALTYLKLANVFSDQGNYTDALNKYHAALNIFESLGDKRGASATQNNIGNIYYEQGNYNEALNEYLASLKIKTEIGDKKGIANSQTNIGSIYYQQGKYPAALKEHFASLKTNEEIRDRQGIAAAHNNIGNVYLKMHNPKESRVEQKKALLLSKEIGHKETIKDSYWGLVKADSALGDNKSALENYKMYIVYRDSLINEENTKKTVQAQMNYEFEKKEAAAKAEQKKEQAVAEAEKKKQQVILYSVISGLLVVLAFAGFIFRSLNITRRQKQLIEVQKTEVDKQKELADSRRIIAEEQKHIIEQQKKIVEEHNKDITDSINYAQRIQRALLASNNILNKNLGEHFVLFKPKDIVSGDFYWASEKDGRFYLAVCDSTGHGVPGAFMSLLNISFLNEAISEKGIKEPNNVLNHSRQRLIENLSSEGAQDGMDGILVCFDKNKNEISYSAAHNEPLLMNGELQHLDSDSMPVGLGDKKDSFTNHIISYRSGNILYLYTDGYADQFGGPKGKKFKYKQLNDLLSANSSKPLSEQKNILDNIFEDWRGNLEQVDDVLVIGIRL